MQMAKRKMTNFVHVVEIAVGSICRNEIVTQCQNVWKPAREMW